jgi:hypothetical protein
MKTGITIIIVLLVAILVYFIGMYFTMKDVKTPKYTVIKKLKSIEVRRYAPMVVAEVSVTGNRREAINRGFRLLADYIFGNNTVAENKNQKISMTAPVIQKSTKITMTAPVLQKSTKIAMTAPVIQQQSDSMNWVVQFVMPASYQMDTLPKPNNKQVTLIQVPEHTVVAIRFSGRATESNMQRYQAKLDQYIKDNNMKVEPGPHYAFYNPPWTLPLLRRNEIMYDVSQ